MATSKIIEELKNQEAKMDLTPVIDMSFLLIIFFMCLPFKSLESKLAAYLPTDKGISPIPQPPSQDIKVSVHIVARDFKETEFGPKDGTRMRVKAPTSVLYKYGDRQSADIEDVYQYIEAAKKVAAQNAAANAAGATVVGEIKANHKIPVKYVVAILNKFAMAGLTKVDFYGTAIPPKQLRQQKPLPYPATDY